MQGHRAHVRGSGAKLAALAAAVVLAASPAVAAPTNDPLLDRQWALFRIGADRAWAAGQGEGITIAIVDTGVDLDHEDLAGNIVGGRDFVDGGPPQDRNGHGTYVAGIAAAVANNGLGIAGVAPKAKIMPIRALDASGSGTLSSIDAGVRWAVDNGAHVVNLSLSAGAVVEIITGGSLSATVNYAWSKGVIPVVAAGNDSLFRRDGNTNALVVAATTREDRRASYSPDVRFARWGIAAPGGSSGSEGEMIVSTYWSDGNGSGPGGNSAYSAAAGTSAATPHVAAAAAILRGLGLSPRQTVDRLLATARDVGQSALGAGRLDLAAAVAGLGPAAPVQTASEGDPEPVEEPSAQTAEPRSTPSPPPPTVVPSPLDEPGPAPSPETSDSEPAEDPVVFGPPVEDAGRTAGTLLVAAAFGSVTAAVVTALAATLRRGRFIRAP